MQATRPASPTTAHTLPLAASFPAAVWTWLERLTPWLLLAWALGFNLVQLWPEVAIGVPSVNDAILHKAALAGAACSAEAPVAAEAADAAAAATLAVGSIPWSPVVPLDTFFFPGKRLADCRCGRGEDKRPGTGFQNPEIA